MTAGKLTTHVLDTMQGRPAVYLLIELWVLHIDINKRVLLKVLRTNEQGRTDEPLLEGDALVSGVYELVFGVGDYFAEQGGAGAQPSFLDRVPVRFGIADPDAHYHVPLLVSPWAYTTYRGS